MSSHPVTRRDLTRELALNAASKRLNLAVPTAVVVAGLLLQTVWLLPFALLVYLSMAVVTFFDGDEAARVGRRTYDRAREARQRPLDTSRFAAPIAAKLDLARIEEQRIRIAAETLPIADPTSEVTRLLDDLYTIAQGAQQIHVYLASQDEHDLRRRLDRLRDEPHGDGALAAANEDAAAALEAHLAVITELRGQLLQFYAQVERITASLATIHGQIIRITAGELVVANDDIAAQVHSLREDAGVAADALRDAYRHVGPHESDDDTTR